MIVSIQLSRIGLRNMCRPPRSVFALIFKAVIATGMITTRTRPALNNSRLGLCTVCKTVIAADVIAAGTGARFGNRWK